VSWIWRQRQVLEIEIADLEARIADLKQELEVKRERRDLFERWMRDELEHSRARRSQVVTEGEDTSTLGA
jgi:hypothetical protein